jgi:L-fucose isomerase-like protein
LTDDPLDTFGPLAVARVPDLQSLMKYICKNGFEHHVAMTMNHVAPNLSEALSTYVK